MIKIDYNIFIKKFPEFKDLTPLDVEVAESQIGAYISPVENTAVLNNALREQGCYLATAVICKEILNLQNAGNNTQGGVIASAGEGSDSVGFQAIPYKTILEWDLLASNIQPYGKMLLRILKLAQPQLPINANINVGYYNNLNRR